MSTNLDTYMMGKIKGKPNLMIPWYLMASYAYYGLDRPLLSDGMFDGLAKAMLAKWKDLEHPHKYLIKPADLRAGTLLRRRFPSITKGATMHLIKEHDL